MYRRAGRPQDEFGLGKTRFRIKSAHRGQLAPGSAIGSQMPGLPLRASVAAQPTPIR